MTPTLRDIMVTRVVTVGLDDKLTDIKDIFENVRFHHLLVVDDGGLLMGVISDRDLLKNLSPFLDTVSEQTRDRSTLDRRAHQIMTRRPITAPPQLSIRTGARLMIENHISCLPIVDENDTILGIVSWKDLLRATTYLD